MQMDPSAPLKRHHTIKLTAATTLSKTKTPNQALLCIMVLREQILEAPNTGDVF